MSLEEFSVGDHLQKDELIQCPVGLASAVEGQKWGVPMLTVSMPMEQVLSFPRMGVEMDDTD